MPTNSLTFEFDLNSTGRILERLADRLLCLESLTPEEVDEETMADAKNDALALRPLYESFRAKAVQTFGTDTLDFSPAIGDLDEIYDLD
jgi:hypothetical protein